MDGFTDEPDRAINPVASAGAARFPKRSMKMRDANWYWDLFCSRRMSFPTFPVSFNAGECHLMDVTLKDRGSPSKTPRSSSNPSVVSYHRCAFTECTNIPLCSLAQGFFDLNTSRLR